MKPLRSFAQQVVRWRQILSALQVQIGSRYCHFEKSLEPLGKEIQKQVHRGLEKGLQKLPPAVQSRLQESAFLGVAFNPQQIRRRLPSQLQVRLPILLIAIVLLTSAMGYRFYNEPELAVGTLSPQLLRAPETATVLDVKTTEANRKAARTAAIPVMAIDAAVNQEIYHSLQRLIDQGNDIRQQAGAFPFVDTGFISTATQQYLRQATDWDWQATIAAVTGQNVPTRKPNSQPVSQPVSQQTPSSPNPSLQVAILELQNYRRTNGTDDFSALQEVVLRARQRYRAAKVSLGTNSLDGLNGVYDDRLLALTDAEWDRTRKTIQLTLERILAQGIAPGLPDALIKNAIKLQLDSGLSANATGLATNILAAVVKPNLIKDSEQTKIRAEQAAQAVQNVVVKTRQGETIVEAGEIITQSDFVLLDHFGMSRRRTNWAGILGFATLVAGAIGVFWLVERRFHPGLRPRDNVLVLLLALSAPILLALSVPGTSLPAIGLLVGSFYGSALGATTVGLLSLLLPVGMDIPWTNLVASAIGGIVGGLMAGRLRTREEFALLGGVVGLVQGSVYLLMSLILSAAATTVWYLVLTGAALQCLMGIAWSVIALGVSPYLEHVFDLITPIRLAELANPNCNMLKRLASEAPGTFQHTLFVSTLAEAAARRLGCNVELVRAGTLYHDIGKMHDPQGFIENQMGGPNKHDAIADPWISADLIKKHVSEGLVMARKCRLPKAIQAFIPEHQGTMTIAYFYHQAQQQAQDDPTITVKESDFRYDGPIPQSRETGIVMLADSCEAALRSLKDASPVEALAMINRILRGRWQDNQLVDSGLSREDLGEIAETFVQVWQQFNHQRIPYPKAVSSPPSNSQSPNSQSSVGV
ncbi:HD family phosphohydrolase [Leptolyngbya ohadii]|uniref:HD family phosphohydrolase n=1 Tax=Leptolyngbya ohadii TaxID=1962290 RepID=UPI000B59A772|nr:HDIG domain-containing metalloprotein [Leptolyngbya ohadii]